MKTVYVICQKCGIDIAAEEASDLPRLYIQQNTQAISRVTCLCSNVFSVGASSSAMYVWRRKRIWAFLLTLSQSPPKEVGILIFVILSIKSHNRSLTILYVNIFLLSEAKIYCHVIFCLVSALPLQPKPTKVDCKCVYK